METSSMQNYVNDTSTVLPNIKEHVLIAEGVLLLEYNDMFL